MKYLGAISDSKDLVNKGYVDNAIPTKVSDLTNDSGFVTTDTNTTYSLSNALSSHKFTETLTAGGSGSGTSTATIELAAGTGISLTDDTSNKKITINCTVTNSDEKVSVAALTSGTAYYPILATGTGTATRQIDSTLGGLKYTSTGGTTSAVGTSVLQLGNSTASGSNQNEQGVLRLYGTTAKYMDIKSETGFPAANRTIYLPSYGGTMYLTCTNTTDAVGNTSVPVYVDNTGRIQKIESLELGLVKKPFIKAHGASTQITLSNAVITQVPLTVVDFVSEYSGVSLDTTKNTILVEPGIYRVTGSVYMAPGGNGAHGVYIRMDSTSIAFANATEVASTYIYTTTSGTINVTGTVKAVDNCYIWLAARGTANTKVAPNSNTTYLEVEKIASVY